MAGLTEAEKEEILEIAGSKTMREDMKYVANHRHNPLLINDPVDMDRLLAFLTQFNEFINHQQKPFKPMIDRVMKL